MIIFIPRSDEHILDLGSGNEDVPGQLSQSLIKVLNL